ncbi:hypothetical protein C8R46DRAFT_3011 [Mycena filopes]|nr:hypothetical protein C8R46DRAFT_3011 [Mycena filopes]
MNSCNHDCRESLPESIQRTSISTPDLNSLSSHRHSSSDPTRSADATTTIQDVIVVVSVETVYASPPASAQVGAETVLAADLPFSPSSMTSSASTSMESFVFSASTLGSVPTAVAATEASSVSDSSSTSGLAVVGGTPATTPPPAGLDNNNGSSPSTKPLRTALTSKAALGSIVGVAVAGLLVVILALLLLFIWLRRRSARAARHSSGSEYEGGISVRQLSPITPFPSDLQPRNNYLAGVTPHQSSFRPSRAPYPFAAPPVPRIGSPKRPARQRGDTFSDLDFSG